MTALAADKPRTYGSCSFEHTERLPLIAGAKVYAGSTLMWDDAGSPTLGVEAHAAAGASKLFAGFSKEPADNTNGALGDKIIDVVRAGIIVLVISATIAASDLGASVYAATDDDTFNLTSTNNTLIGKITRVVTAGASGSNSVEVEFNAKGFE